MRYPNSKNHNNITSASKNKQTAPKYFKEGHKVFSEQLDSPIKNTLATYLIKQIPFVPKPEKSTKASMPKKQGKKRKGHSKTHPRNRPKLFFFVSMMHFCVFFPKLVNSGLHVLRFIMFRHELLFRLQRNSKYYDQ